MIVIIQAILTLILSVFYAIEVVDFTNWLSILSLVGFYIGINIAYALIVILLFIVIVYLTRKVNVKAIWKHDLYMMFSRYFFYTLLRVKVIVKGLENLPKNKRFVVYANHIEYNDPLYIKQYYKHTSLAFIAKKPLFRYPIVKDVLKSVGCIPIGRLADRESLEAILKGIKQVKDGQPMGLFPEGKRSYSNDLDVFKPGAFKVAQKSKADLSLVVLYDFHKINEKKLRLRKVKVYMTILPVIPYESYKNMDTVQISQMVYQLINQELDQYKNMKNS